MEKMIHPLAQRLNDELAARESVLYEMLAPMGRRIYFPEAGILGQSAEAKGSAINATIGIAFEEDGLPLCLECLESLVNLPCTAYLYAPSFGLPQLRQVWRDLLSQKNPSLKQCTFSLPVVTHALTHGLDVAGYLFVAPGDEIILPDLYWDNYELLFEEGRGAKLTTYPMFKEGTFNVAGLAEQLAAPGTKKIVILNFPNNPTGYTATEGVARALTETLLSAAEAGKQLVVLLDDAYFGLVYEAGVVKESLFGALANLHPNLLAVKLDGATKEDYVWGMRIGFITFGNRAATPEQYKALEAKVGGVVRGSISSATHIGQSMLLQAYQCPDYQRQKQEKYEVLWRRYQTIKKLLAQNPAYARSFQAMPFNSGYFMCIKPLGVEAEEVRRQLLEHHQIGVIQLMGLIRIAFSSVPNDQLERLFACVHEVVSTLQAR